MPTPTPAECFKKLRGLYIDANRCEPTDDHKVIDWATHPEHWATQQIAHRGWHYLAAEAVVRQCRILRNRAARHLPEQQA
jgi:hypothetical protein